MDMHNFLALLGITWCVGIVWLIHDRLKNPAEPDPEPYSGGLIGLIATFTNRDDNEDEGTIVGVNERNKEYLISTRSDCWVPGRMSLHAVPANRMHGVRRFA